MTRLERSRPELAAFLRSRREQLRPADLGLPSGRRRRTPGLRREEVAALAGVGLTWYTWLEQGRAIGVSDEFLESLSRVLRLDGSERRHLYLLAQDRPPSEPGRTWCVAPPLTLRLMRDLAPHAAYIINLRWDVLAFNAPAGRIFGFGAHEEGERNLLRLLFTDSAYRRSFSDWADEAPAMLASFRRDHANAREDSDTRRLLDELTRDSPEFAALWRRQDVHAPCTGRRRLAVEGVESLFEHTSLVLDGGRHLRMVVYAPVEEELEERPLGQTAAVSS